MEPWVQALRLSRRVRLGRCARSQNYGSTKEKKPSGLRHTLELLTAEGHCPQLPCHACASEKEKRQLLKEGEQVNEYNQATT